MQHTCEAVKCNRHMLEAFKCCGGRSFIGQGKTGKAGAGQTQKEQQQALADFTAEKFNLLVATCIGEEGLDICQVHPGFVVAPLYSYTWTGWATSGCCASCLREPADNCKTFS